MIRTSEIHDADPQWHSDGGQHPGGGQVLTSPHGSVWLLNIRRFRPLNSKELEAGDESVVIFPETQNDREVKLLVKDKTEKGKGEKKERKFTFDKILKPTVTQSQVYDATAKNIVKGDNLCCLP